MTNIMLAGHNHTPYLFRNWNGTSISYTPDLDGGGLVFADDYLAMLAGLGTKMSCGHILEWCSGPGFIGYALMAYGFCDRLSLTDCYEPAIAAAKQTATSNNIDRLVDIYCSDGISALPETAMFDLIVGNPPNFPNRIMQEVPTSWDSKANPRMYVDENWRLHKQFFAGIRKHLTPNGRIILLESTNGSHLETFRPMIEAGGLKIDGWQWSRKRGTDMWYLFASRDDGTAPFSVATPPD